MPWKAQCACYLAVAARDCVRAFPTGMGKQGLGMEDKIQTLHPKGKNGVRIDKAKYETMRAAILEVLAEGPCAFTPMTERIAQKLEGSFPGSISWYAVTVKQDLEARGIVRPLPGTKPVKLLTLERD